MDICIVGGGINGSCCAWVLSQKGHKVHLYKRDKLVSKTSRLSSKLLHGGLRYLEHGNFRLVKEALKERDAWLQRVPSLTQPNRLVLPIYENSSRNRLLVKAGLFLYDNLAGPTILPKSKWPDVKVLIRKDPQLNADGLKGGYEFSDGQMDEHQLGLWVAEQAKQEGTHFHENTPIESIDIEGNVQLKTEVLKYDHIINVAGPWAEQLLNASGIDTPHQLDGVRGSHLVINKKCPQPYLLEVPKEKRIFFLLPWKENTLIGTTEVMQLLDEPIKCTDAERDYLLTAFNHYYINKITKKDVIESFAGIRPLLSSATDIGLTTREYAIHSSGKLTNIFGEKWTTALALANKVSKQVDEKND